MPATERSSRGDHVLLGGTGVYLLALSQHPQAAHIMRRRGHTAITATSTAAVACTGTGTRTTAPAPHPGTGRRAPSPTTRMAVRMCPKRCQCRRAQRGLATDGTRAEGKCPCGCRAAVPAEVGQYDDGVTDRGTGGVYRASCARQGRRPGCLTALTCRAVKGAALSPTVRRLVGGGGSPRPSAPLR